MIQKSKIGVDPLMPFNEVANTLAVSRQQVYRMVRAGLLPQPLKQGRRSFWHTSAVTDYSNALPSGTIGKKGL